MGEEKKKNVELEQGYNGVTIVGNAKEYSVGIYETKKEITDDDGETREIVSAYISGRLVTDVNGSAINNWIRFNKHRHNGDKNDLFTNICTAFGITCGYDEDNNQATYKFEADKGITPSIDSEFILRRINEDADSQKVTKVNGASNNTTVKVKGNIKRSTMLNRDDSDVVVTKRINVTAIEKGINENEKATFAIDGFIEDIIRRVDNNGNETGELDISLLIPAYNNNIDILSFRVPKQWAIDEETTLTSEDFLNWAEETIKDDSYSMTKIMGALTTVSSGRQPKKSTRAFGQQVELNSGFTRVEWHITGGDNADAEQKISKEVMDDFKKEWKIFLDAEYKRLKDDKAGTKGKNSKPQGQGVKGNIDKKGLPF